MSNEHFASLYLRAILKEMFGGEPIGWNIPVDKLLGEHLWSNSLLHDGWNPIHTRGEGFNDTANPTAKVNALIGVTSIARVVDGQFVQSARTLCAAHGGGGKKFSQHVFLAQDDSVDGNTKVFTLNGASIDSGVVVFCDKDGKVLSDETIFVKEPHAWPYPEGYRSPEDQLKDKYNEALAKGELPECPYYEWGINLSSRLLKEAAENSSQWDTWRDELAQKCSSMGYEKEFFQVLLLGAVTNIKVTSGAKKSEASLNGSGDGYKYPLLSYTVPIWTMWIRGINRLDKLQNDEGFQRYKASQKSRVSKFLKNINANLTEVIAAEKCAPPYVKATIEANKQTTINPQKPTIANADLSASGAPAPLNVEDDSDNSLLQRQAAQRNGAKPPGTKKVVTNLTPSTPPSTPSVVTTNQAPPSLTKAGLEGSAPPRRTEEKSVKPNTPETKELTLAERLAAQATAIASAKREAAPLLDDGDADGSFNWD